MAKEPTNIAPSHSPQPSRKKLDFVEPFSILAEPQLLLSLAWTPYSSEWTPRATDRVRRFGEPLV